jgi:hypothetical protein
MDLPAVVWRKSSYSGSQSDCLELALTGNSEAVRDSKNPDGGVLTVDVTRLVTMVKVGRFDHH